MIKSYLVYFFAIVLIISSSQASAQEKSKTESSDKPTATLIASRPYENSEIASAIIDILRTAVANEPNGKGIFIIYCGKVCSYGEVEAHLRGLNISLTGKGWKTTDYTIIQGGFRNILTVEYWVVPENACSPMPSPTININDVKFKGVYKRRIVYYDCC